ncbi:MAG: enolase C-terminal domain-like protein [Candidatus Elarobacter sp.]
MIADAQRNRAPVSELDVHAYRIPTQGGPESDGTLVWGATTLVLVEIAAGGKQGIGYTYADTATAVLIRDTLRELVLGQDAFENAAIWVGMVAAIRNLGRDGITSMAISAIDVALWDLKGKLLETSVASLLGIEREAVPIYGSGGFTSYDLTTLCDQLGGWVQAGIPRVKMKIGRDPEADIRRIAAARRAIGDDAELFVDANGAYARKQALEQAARFAESRVSWYEEPVYHQDFEGLAMVRAAAPARMEVTSGEYGYGIYHFARMLEEKTVDVLQADATRCGGFSGLLAVDGLCQAKLTPLSTHCAPYLHLHVGASAKMLRHMEFFFDHVRIERMLFDGVPEPQHGTLAPDLSRPGVGLEFRRADAEQFAV